MMDVSRRSLLGFTGTSTAAASLGFLGLNLGSAVAHADERAKTLKKCHVSTTICPYCAVGCGAMVMTVEEHGKKRIVNLEGDPDHPINEGSLCPKGSSMRQLSENTKRLGKVLYRASGATSFVEKDWGWAAKEIAKRIKATRDATFQATNAKDQVVNRTTAIASIGSAALDNEECWIYQKMLRAINLTTIEHQARI